MPFSRRFSYVLLQSFRTRFTIAVISSAAVAERSPCTAQRSGGGAHHSCDLLKQGAFSSCIDPCNGGFECNRLVSSLALGTQGLPVESRLSEVIDTHSKRTDTRRRFRAISRWMARLVLISLVGSWLFLYIDSVYQRRRAESLLADLRSLDFSTAGFAEVRDIMIRNGVRPGSTCDPQNCTFLLQIMTRLPRIPLLDRKATFFYTTLPYIGVRSWVLV